VILAIGYPNNRKTKSFSQLIFKLMINCGTISIGLELHSVDYFSNQPQGRLLWPKYLTNIFFINIFKNLIAPKAILCVIAAEQVASFCSEIFTCKHFFWNNEKKIKNLWHVKQDWKIWSKSLTTLSGGEEPDMNHANRMSIEPMDLFAMIFGTFLKSAIICVLRIA
jgi:hypothetical protein